MYHVSGIPIPAMLSNYNPSPMRAALPRQSVPGMPPCPTLPPAWVSQLQASPGSDHSSYAAAAQLRSATARSPPRLGRSPVSERCSCPSACSAPVTLRQPTSWSLRCCSLTRLLRRRPQCLSLPSAGARRLQASPPTTPTTSRLYGGNYLSMHLHLSC